MRRLARVACFTIALVATNPVMAFTAEAPSGGWLEALWEWCTIDDEQGCVPSEAAATDDCGVQEPQ